MGGIINARKLKKLQRELDGLRAGKHNINSDDLVNFAKKLGRRKVTRGKHPTYVNDLLPSRPPLSIPSNVKSYTAVAILDDLEIDLVTLSELLEKEAKKNGEHGERKALPPAAVRPDRNSG